MQKSKKNSIAKQAAILSISGIIVRAIGLLYRIPLSRIIGDIGNSYYGIAFNIYTVLLLLSAYSIPLAVSKLISKYRALGQFRNAHRYFISSLIFISIISGILSIFLYIFSPYLLPVGNEKAVFALRTLAPTLFISGFIGVFQGYFQATRNNLPTAIAQILEQVLNASTSILFAFLLTKYTANDPLSIGSVGALGSTLGTLFGSITSISILYYIYSLRKNRIRAELRKDTNSKLIPAKTIYISLISLLLPIILSTVVTNISGFIDQYLYYSLLIKKGINPLSVSTAYGIYVGKVIPISNIASSLASSIAISTLPIISISLARKNIRLVNSTINESVTLSMLFSLPATTGLFVLAKNIIDLIFPHTLNIGYISLQLITIVIVLNSYYIVLSGVLQGLGKPIITVIAGLISILVNIIFIVPLLIFTNLGVYSIIISFIPSNLIMCIICYSYLKKYTGYRQSILRPFILPLIASLLMGIFCKIIYTISIFILKLNFLALSITIPLTIFIYAILIIKMNFVSIKELNSIRLGRKLIRVMKKIKVI